MGLLCLQHCCRLVRGQRPRRSAALTGRRPDQRGDIAAYEIVRFGEADGALQGIMCHAHRGGGSRHRDLLQRPKDVRRRQLAELDFADKGEDWCGTSLFVDAVFGDRPPRPLASQSATAFSTVYPALDLIPASNSSCRFLSLSWTSRLVRPET